MKSLKWERKKLYVVFSQSSITPRSFTAAVIFNHSLERENNNRHSAIGTNFCNQMKHDDVETNIVPELIKSLRRFYSSVSTVIARTQNVCRGYF